MNGAFFFGDGERHRDDRRSTEASCGDDPDLDLVTRATGSVGGEGRVPSLAQMPHHLLQATDGAAAGGASDHQMAETLQRPRHIFPITMAAAQNGQPTPAGMPEIGIGHHQQLIVEKGMHVGSAALMQAQNDVLIDVFPARHNAEAADDERCQDGRDPHHDCVEKASSSALSAHPLPGLL